MSEDRPDFAGPDPGREAREANRRGEGPEARVRSGQRSATTILVVALVLAIAGFVLYTIVAGQFS